VPGEDRSFAAPYVTMMGKDALLCRYELRDMFDALGWIARGRAVANVAK
jgi:hypothetical protein